MPALEEQSVMGRRAKLLKPRSWGATDICLFSISPPSIVLYPHFTVLTLSARPASVSPGLYVSSLLHRSWLFYSFSSSFCFPGFFFLILLPVVLPLFRVKTSRVPRTLSGSAERICIIFSPESVCNHHALLLLLCDD